MSIQARQPSAYAPAKSDPIRLASATIQAVDQIGVATSTEIEKAAADIMRGATEIAEKLHALASAIREHSKIANGHVTDFCEKATSVFEFVRDLERKLEVNEHVPETKDAEGDASALPAVIRKGPAEFDDRRL